MLFYLIWKWHWATKLLFTFYVLQIVHDELVKLMGGEVSELVFEKSGPTVILLAGLQGVGKTTVCAKLANYLKKLVHLHKHMFFLCVIASCLEKFLV